jgi:hypothetical protein
MIVARRIFAHRILLCGVSSNLYLTMASPWCG